MTHPPPNDPLRDPRTMILELSDDQARPFAGLGEVFAIVSRGSYPGFAGRLCLFVTPCEKATAAAACNVALGTYTAKRIKTVTSQPRATLTPANTP
jgi:hypothetical protein